MKHSYKIAVGIIATAGLGLAAASSLYAEPGPMGGGMGHGMMGSMGPGMMQQGGHAGSIAGQQLMTPEERSAFQEKMRNAKTPEEHQKLADANRAEKEKRAKDKGITLPGPHGPGRGFGPGFQAQTH
jgi:Spy/CpxP family protein refolding chaperone